MKKETNQNKEQEWEKEFNIQCRSLMILLSPEYKKHLKSFIRQVRKEAQLEILEEVEKTLPDITLFLG